jgi:hypothetical protein
MNPSFELNIDVQIQVQAQLQGVLSLTLRGPCVGIARYSRMSEANEYLRLGLHRPLDGRLDASLLVCNWLGRLAHDRTSLEKLISSHTPRRTSRYLR